MAEGERFTIRMTESMVTITLHSINGAFDYTIHDANKQRRIQKLRGFAEALVSPPILGSVHRITWDNEPVIEGLQWWTGSRPKYIIAVWWVGDKVRIGLMHYEGGTAIRDKYEGTYRIELDAHQREQHIQYIEGIINETINRTGFVSDKSKDSDYAYHVQMAKHGLPKSQREAHRRILKEKYGVTIEDIKE